MNPRKEKMTVPAKIDVQEFTVHTIKASWMVMVLMRSEDHVYDNDNDNDDHLSPLSLS